MAATEGSNSKKSMKSTTPYNRIQLGILLHNPACLLHESVFIWIFNEKSQGRIAVLCVWEVDWFQFILWGKLLSYWFLKGRLAVVNKIKLSRLFGDEKACSFSVNLMFRKQRFSANKFDSIEFGMRISRLDTHN